MANVRWTGEAVAVAQVDTITVGGTIEADDIFILTVTGWDGTSYALSVVGGSTTASVVATTIAAAWNASTHALLTPNAASTDGADVILTADTAGVPFTVAASTTETGGGAADDQTFTLAHTTASAGPSHWDSVENWDGGALPANTNDVFIDNSSSDILYGLDQSAVETLASLNIGKSFTGKIGYNGAAGYSGTYLQVACTVINIGKHSGPGSPSGSGRIMIDTGTVASTINVYGTSNSPTDTNKPSVRLLANEATTVLNVKKGKVGVAYESGETSTLATINESYESNKTSDADVYIGSGVTLTTLYKTGGSCELGCAATTVTNFAGDIETLGSGEITTFTNHGGTAMLKSTGRIITCNAIGGVTDVTKSAGVNTLTTVKVGGAGQFKYNPALNTLTNKIQPYETTGDLSVSIFDA